MASDSKQVKIVLLTGYLGAGKTTLLNRILANRKGMRVAVIVNDIGEVNVDAALIGEGGLAESSDIVALTNGCICCTLADDLAQQLAGIARSGSFDYIVIEASGICEPIPIAYTISEFCAQSQGCAAPLYLDNIVAVVDCARMFDEFSGGESLLAQDVDEEDIESLLIQQIEFCTTLVLNKTDKVSPEQLAGLKSIVGALQPSAKIIEAQHADVPLEDLLDTGRFNFEDVYNSAVWADAMEHPEEHDNPEVLEYDVTTFVYERTRPFDLEALGQYALSWPKEVVRSKGVMWVAQNPEVRHLLEQAGSQVSVTEMGPWASADARGTKLCIIGRHMDRAAVEAGLDACLA